MNRKPIECVGLKTGRAEGRRTNTQDSDKLTMSKQSVLTLLLI